jgi:hypothetical protein
MKDMFKPKILDTLKGYRRQQLAKSHYLSEWSNRMT